MGQGLRKEWSETKALNGNDAYKMTELSMIWEKESGQN